MRFDLAAFRQVLPHKASSSLPTVLAVGGISLAMLTVAYVTLFGADRSAAEAEVRADVVAVTGPVFTPVAATAPVSTRYADLRDADPSLPPQFEDASTLTRAVQTGLKRAGCYRGPVNGRWTSSTRAAMGAFTDRVNARLPIDRPDSVLLALIETHDDISCAPSEGAHEVAAVEEMRPPVAREALLSPSATAEPHADEPWLASETEQHAPERTASVDPEETAEVDRATMAPAVVAPAPRVAKRERPRRTTRKYRRKPSFSREVRRSFRSIRRSMIRLF